jgi:hypothetical protein
MAGDHTPDGPDPDDPRPWEQPGAVRRDCAPHRSNWLLVLAVVALALGLSSFCLVVTGFIAMPVAAAVGRLAARDLGEMRAGRMDPQGRRMTRLARGLAISAEGLVGLAAVLWLAALAAIPPGH